MYVPEAYKMNDKNTLIRFIEQYSFGILFSQSDNGPLGSNLPFIYEKKGDEEYLISHMARKNPQWNEINEDVLVVFSGPEAYISSAWYEGDIHIPTWNFITTHVYGDFQVIEDPIETRKVMEYTINYFETKTHQSKTNIVIREEDKHLLDHIVAFKIKINKMEGYWKLHQNYSTNIKKKVIRQLEESSNEKDRQIAALMKKWNEIGTLS